MLPKAPDGLTPEQRKAWNHANTRLIRDADAAAALLPPPEGRVFQRGDSVELGIDLAKTLGPAGDVVQAEDRIWQWTGATWTRWDDAPLAKQAQSYAGQWVVVPAKIAGDADKFRPILISDTRNIVENCKIHLQEPAFFANAPVGIPFANCFARIDGVDIVVEPLTRAHRVKTEHASPFDLELDRHRPEVTDRLLAMAWANKPDADERIRFFWEWLGAALAGIATRYKDTPILYGPKDTGKSQILHVVTSCFPVTSHRAVTLQNMASEYHRAYLSGGRINSVNELPARELMDGEAAKAILSGDVVNCRRPRENPFDWTPRCAHIFSTNGLPPSRDDALMDRFCLLDCDQVVADADKDRDLANKITAEAPQIAAAALESLQTLLRRGHLIRPGSTRDLTSDWRMNSDPIHAWAHECLQMLAEFDTGSTLSSDLYAAFRDYAKDGGFVAPSIIKFTVRLKSLGFVYFRGNGSRFRALLNGPARQQAQSAWAGNDRYGRD